MANLLHAGSIGNILAGKPLSANRFLRESIGLNAKNCAKSRPKMAGFRLPDGNQT